MKYQVEIIETLTRTVEIDAENIIAAERLAHQKYCSGEIVLGGDDFVQYDVKAVDGT